MPRTRRKPFSNKQKKAQLHQKKQKKKEQSQNGSSPDDSDDGEEQPQSLLVKKLHHTEVAGQLTPHQRDPNRFKLHFEKESRQELERRKRNAKTVTIITVDEVALEVDVDEIYQPGSVLDIPKRPPWSFSMTKEEVELQEEIMFQEYLEKIHVQYTSQQLSYFEHNLETWRQLWRVLEISDVMLLITDIRHPVLHFPPALYTHVVQDLKKQLILILNKIDLVPPAVAIAWKHYFQLKFPQVHVVCFTSFPDKDVSIDSTTKIKMRAKRKYHYSPVGSEELFHVIMKLFPNNTSLNVALGNDDTSPDEPRGKIDNNDVFTIGLIGHPNVGKSSIINALMGKKLVSTSRTPGHTKHLQTLFLTQSVRLCDCPGLIFPSLIDKQLQILSGLYPISQVQEPYSSVGYLAERVPLIELLGLTHPNDDETHITHIMTKAVSLQDDPNTTESSRATLESRPSWTPWDICDGIES
jgi:ribosome biogenesis GTPase A